MHDVQRYMETTANAAPDASRVLVTLLFTDIVGSTRLAAEIGDRGWMRLIERHHAKVRELFAGFDGREVDCAGDGFFATFDTATSAIRCGDAIRSSVGSLGLEVRAGVHTGECERADSRVRGIAVHTAARLVGVARPGEVLVTATVRDVVAGSGIRFEDRGARALRGIPGVWRLFAVTNGEQTALHAVVPDERSGRGSDGSRWRRGPRTAAFSGTRSG
jgi:class 3 adenylate cyclase